MQGSGRGGREEQSREKVITNDATKAVCAAEGGGGGDVHKFYDHVKLHIIAFNTISTSALHAVRSGVRIPAG